MSKKLRILLFIVFFVVICCCINFTISVSASEGEILKTFDVFDTENRTDPNGITLSEIVKNTYSEKAVEQLYQSTGEIYRPSSYWVDPTVYIVEYTASESFLTNLKKVDAQGVVSEMFGSYPILYIPIFGVVENVERVVGHVKIYLTSHRRSMLLAPHLTM